MSKDDLLEAVVDAYKSISINRAPLSRYYTDDKFRYDVYTATDSSIEQMSQGVCPDFIKDKLWFTLVGHINTIEPPTWELIEDHYGYKNMCIAMKELHKN